MTRRTKPTGHYRAQVLDQLNRLKAKRDKLRTDGADRWRINLVGAEIADKELILARIDGAQLGYEGRNDY